MNIYHENFVLIMYDLLQGWLTVHEEGKDKKRWAVLRGNKLTLYDTVLCQVVKDEILLVSHLLVEVSFSLLLFKAIF